MHSKLEMIIGDIRDNETHVSMIKIKKQIGVLILSGINVSNQKPFPLDTQNNFHFP